MAERRLRVVRPNSPAGRLRPERLDEIRHISGILGGLSGVEYLAAQTYLSESMDGMIAHLDAVETEQVNTMVATVAMCIRAVCALCRAGDIPDVLDYSYGGSRVWHWSRSHDPEPDLDCPASGIWLELKPTEHAAVALLLGEKS